MNTKDLMTREVLSVAPEASLNDVARALVERGSSGLPVCDDAGRVLGLTPEPAATRRRVGSSPHVDRRLS